MAAEDFPTRLAAAGVVGVLRAPSAAAAVQAALAASRGGLRALEVTFTTPDAAQALLDLRDGLPPDVMLGAGSVMDTVQAEAALASGATFLVSPHLGEDVLEAALAAQADYVPGVLTPSEVARAQRLGVSTVKIFPIGSSGSIPYLRDLLGPFPRLRAMVTGGDTPPEVPAYLAAGAIAVGLGSNLFPKAALEAADWQEVEVATRRALGEAGRMPGATST